MKTKGLSDKAIVKRFNNLKKIYKHEGFKGKDVKHLYQLEDEIKYRKIIYLNTDL